MENVELSHDGRRILSDALTLSAHDRAVLADELLASLDPLMTDLDDTTRQELRRRIAAIESGEVESYSAEEVFDELDREHGWT